MTSAAHQQLTTPASTTRAYRSRNDLILNALEQLAHRRPHLDPRDYLSAQDLRAERVNLARDLRDAKAMIAEMRLHTPTTASDLLAGFNVKRDILALTEDVDSGQVTLEFLAGRYKPHDHRKAICEVLASALMLRQVRYFQYIDRRTSLETTYRIRKYLRLIFNAGIVSRWFT